MFKNGGVDLATFVGGIVRALTKGQQALVKSRREQIDKHFTLDDNGVYQPDIMKFQVGDNQILNIPKYVLSRVNTIGIETAVIHCSAKIVDIKEDEVNCELTDHKYEVRYYVKPSTPKNKTFEIEITFSKKTEIESENRLCEGLMGLVEVQHHQSKD